MSRPGVASAGSAGRPWLMAVIHAAQKPPPGTSA
jgi:hypothetical protein